MEGKRIAISDWLFIGRLRGLMLLNLTGPRGEI